MAFFTTQSTARYPLFTISVKKYMTEKSTPEFDFMAQRNNDIPMPYRTMVGFVLAETKGMVKMRCRADIVTKETETCMCCGRPITNAVSRYFGVGPICGHHNYTNPFNTYAELKDAVNKYRKETLNKIVWEGWIPKSAITAYSDFVEQ